MRNALSVASRIITQITMDRRTLALLIVAPLLLITVFWLVIHGAVSKPNVALVGNPSTAFTDALRANSHLVESGSSADALALLKNEQVDAVLDYSGPTPALTVDGADPTVTGLVAQAVQKSSQAAIAVNPVVAAIAKRMIPTITLLHGRTDASAFDFLAPVMMGFVIFFFIFILSGISFLRERVSGTLERIFATPCRPIELTTGYMMGFGFFAVIQTALIQLFTIKILGTPAHGSFVDILVVNIALCLVALSLGSLVSAFARTEFQVMQFIPIVIVPQILFSGILDLRGAPGWVRALSNIFPLTYGGHALRELMLRGRSLRDVLPDLLIVLGFAALFVALNTVALHRARAH